MKALVLTATLALAVHAPSAHAQFGWSVTFDPTQSAHVLKQIADAEKAYTTTVQTYDTVVGTYNLAKRMASAPQSLFTSYGSGLPPWLPMLPSNDTHGNTQSWLDTVNKYDAKTAKFNGKAASALQQASIARVAKLTGYDKLDAKGQQAVAAQTATLDIGDSTAATNLQTVGTIRANQQQRMTEMNTLEAASHSTDPAQQTELATLQRINQALLLMIRNQQDESLLLQGQTLQQTINEKDAMDATKMQFEVGQNYEANYNSRVNADSHADRQKALHY